MSPYATPSPMNRNYHIDHARFPTVVERLVDIAHANWIAPWDIADLNQVNLIQVVRSVELASQWLWKVAILAQSGYAYEFSTLQRHLEDVPEYVLVRAEFFDSPIPSYDELDSP